MTTTKNNEHKKLNVPNLRFPEFEGEWEKCTLGNLIKVQGGYAFKSEKFQKTGIPIIRISNLPQNASFVELDDCVYYEKGKYDSFEVHKGDLLIAMSGATTGKTAIYNSNTLAYLNQRVGLFKSTNGECLYYPLLYAVVSTPVFRNQLATRLIAGAQPNISSSDIETIRISIPQNNEQKKIAHLLSLLDERIATQNKIINKLQSLIKGLEDNLLDNPLWEKTYLSSFMQFFSTNSLSWEQLSYEEGEIRNLHYGLIHGFQTRGINSASLPMIKNEAVPKQYTLCQVGDVAFADASEDTGEIAKSVEFVDTIEGDTICGLHTIHGRDIKNRTVVGFKGFAFNSRYFHNQIKRLAQGTKVFSITSNNLSSCYVYLPDLETQKAIVKLLKAYEAQLLVSRKTLKQYENQKQYLLRQMFI